jgi:hypothetical protein
MGAFVKDLMRKELEVLADGSWVMGERIKGFTMKDMREGSSLLLTLAVLTPVLLFFRPRLNTQ